MENARFTKNHLLTFSSNIYRCHRFFINCIFFFLYPFRLCCCCFWGSDHDRKRSTSSIIGRSVIQQEFTDDDESEDEKSRLLKVPSSHVYSFDPMSSQTLFNILEDSDVEGRLDKDAGYVINAYNQSHDNLRKLVSRKYLLHSVL